MPGLESTLASAEVGMLSSLDYRLPSVSNFVTERKEVTYYPLGGNSYSPTGVRVLTFQCSGLGFLDASSVIVGVNGEEIPCDEGSYTYDLGTLEGEEIGVIIFERSEMPPPQSKVTVSYDLGTGEPAAFCPDAEATEDEETE